MTLTLGIRYKILTNDHREGILVNDNNGWKEFRFDDGSTRKLHISKSLLEPVQEEKPHIQSEEDVHIDIESKFIPLIEKKTQTDENSTDEQFVNSKIYESEKNDLRVMSFNIQTFGSRKQGDSGIMYDRKLNNICTEMINSKADIFVFQELFHIEGARNIINQCKQDGLNLTGYVTPVISDSKYYERAFFCYNPKKVEIIGSPILIERREPRTMRKPALARFKKIGSESTLDIMSVHLSFGDPKIDLLHLIMYYLDAFKGDIQLLLGDFNCNDRDLFKELEKREFKSAVKGFTNFKNDKQYDYIFVKGSKFKDSCIHQYNYDSVREISDHRPISTTLVY